METPGNAWEPWKSSKLAYWGVSCTPHVVRSTPNGLGMLSTYIDLTEPGLPSVVQLTMMELTVLEFEKSPKIDVFHAFWACLQLQCSSMSWRVTGIQKVDRDRSRLFVYHQEKSIREHPNLFWAGAERFRVWVGFVFWSFPPCTKTLPPLHQIPSPPAPAILRQGFWRQEDIQKSEIISAKPKH